MRIVCDTCGTPYTVDEAHASRVGCSHCSRTLVVRGAPAPEVAWHLLIGDQPAGPLTTAELTEQLATGQLDEETLVWREGLEDWRPLGEVSLPRAPALRPRLEADPLATDVEAWASASTNGSTRPSPLVAARREASVLFSLADLRSLACPASPAEQGSGLIEIRSLAPAVDEYVMDGPPAVAAAPALLLPYTAPARPWLVPVLAGVMTSLLATVAVLLVIVLRERPVAATGAPAPQRSRPAPAATPPSPPAPEPRRAPAPPVVTEEDAMASRAPAPRRTSRPSLPPRPRQTRRAPDAPRARELPPAAAPARTAATDPLGALIDKAIASKPAPQLVATRTAARPLPPLEKSAIQAGVRALRPQIQACFDRYRVSGQADLRFTIEASGRVSAARAQGRFAGTPTGACLEAAFRAGSFPASGDGLTITFPVLLS